MLFRVRVDEPLLAKANEVTRRLGTSTPEMVRIFLAQIARTGRVPLDLSTNFESLAPWESRAKTLESFYDESKTW